MRTVAAVLGAALCLLLGGCGVPLQESPEDVRAAPSGGASSPFRADGPRSATIFLVDGERLVPVQRETSETSRQALLLLLEEGPTEREVSGGLRSALPAGSVDESTLLRGPRVRGRSVHVGVTTNFTGTTGDDQLLATAQLVWTVTSPSTLDRVRVTLAGRPIELPTDAGLTARLVGRNDYRTVAP